MNEDFTEDRLLDGRIILRQPKRGFRAGVDFVLLGAAIEAEPGTRLMEAGCGAGAALLCAAAHLQDVRIIGVERNASMANLARTNVAQNGFATRIEIETGDALAWGRPFDGVFLNPPYDEEGEAQEPHPARREAYLSAQSIDAWMKALADRLTGGALLTMIHRAHKLGEILAALEGRLGGVEILPIRPRAEEPAKRVLVRARKGSRAPLTLLRGLELHDASGAKYTPHADAILRGAARVVWR